ncbi:MAG: hypothetical protein SVR08_13460 [Spirochaetota bacterium]|nr:hypothetical protein [Spirochaetota bacterium]
MITNSSKKHDKPIHILYPGDYYAVNRSCILGTVTGATVVVCIYDTDRGIGGMGHFVIPGMIGTEGIFVDEIAKHGIQNMELLMAEIVKLGGDRKYLKAKIFGASYNSKNCKTDKNIVDSNVKFLHEYFNIEKINIENEDMGGSYRRKIYFLPLEGSVFRLFLKRNDDASEFKKMEKEYIDRVFRNKEKYGKLFLFE